LALTNFIFRPGFRKIKEDLEGIKVFNINFPNQGEGFMGVKGRPWKGWP